MMKDGGKIYQVDVSPFTATWELRFVIPAFLSSFLSHDGTDSPPDADEVVVVLNNFKSKIIKVKVSLVY